MSVPDNSLKRIYLVLPYLALLYLSLFHFDFILDDPFISFRYARNLLDGFGPVFNAGERVEGYSNFLWIILLMPFMKLGINPVIASKLLGLFFGMLAIYYAYGLSLLVFVDNPQKHNVAFYSSAVTGFSWYFSLWCVGGLETSLFAFLILLAIYLFVRCDYLGGSFDWSFVPLALAGMTRPEAPLFFVVFFFVKLFLLVKKHRRIKSIVIWAAGLTVVYGSYFAWRAFYYGQFLPNSYYAKTLGGTQQYLLGARYLRAFLMSQGRIFLLLFTLSLFGLSRLLLKNSAIRLVLLFLSGYLAFIVYAGGDWMAGFRFLAQVQPIYAVLLASSLIELVDYATLRGRLSRCANLIALCLFLLTIGSSLQGSYQDLRQSVPWLGNWFNRLSLSRAGPYYDVASYLNYNVPPGSWVALGEAGMIPYYAKHINVIDIFGLMDRHIAHIAGLLHQKGDAEYVLGRNPDYILLLVQEDEAGIIRYAEQPMRQLLDSRLFTERYKIIFKMGRGESGGLRDMFYFYRRSDLPDASLNLEALGFKEIPDVRLEVSPAELMAGKSTLYLHVANLDASAIDILYTLNGKDMPIIHAWPLNSDHSASLFVGSNTPKGRYVYRAIRDSRDSSPTGWIRVDVPAVVR
jgi:arabinofuranosyltransferase